MQIDENLRPVVALFDFPGTLEGFEEIKTGHINRTYRLRFVSGGAEKLYTLQRINSYVFKKLAEVTQNMLLVTEHLSRALAAQGVNPENRVLKLVSARDGEAMAVDAEGGCWRAYEYITHAKTVDAVESPAQFMEIGRAFGDFQSMLSDFPIEKLNETIPSFHDTRKRLGDFERSVALDVAGRAAEVPEEIALIRRWGPSMCRIVEMLEAGEVPLRVTHNDTKINNVLLDEDTGSALCVIDLDTVMPGSALYDFGDAIRYGACTAAEDETDLDKVSMDVDLFAGFAEGFISRTASRLTRTELENLPLGAMVMTFENAMRFLADHLDGDVYYRIDRPGHNLDRARCQMKLLLDMDAHRAEMDGIVRRLIETYC